MSFYQKYNKTDQVQTEYKLMKNGIIHKKAGKSEMKNVLIENIPKLQHTDFNGSELTREGLKKVTEYINYANNELELKRDDSEDVNNNNFKTYRGTK